MRVADDYATIKQRMQELAQEQRAPSPQGCDACAYAYHRDRNARCPAHS
jgi:hypothetical protein